MKKNVILLCLMVGVLAVLSACQYVTASGNEEEVIIIERDKAENLDIELNLGAGKMKVVEGTDEWIEGVVLYNNDKLKPKVSYKLKKDTGNIVIDQSKNAFSTIKMGDIKNEWDLKLTNEVPIKLNVNTGAAETELDLQGLKLSELEVNAGVGDITVDLSGDWKDSFNVDLHMGIGSSKIILPKEVGVKIISSKGIGETDFKGLISQGDGVYVNEAYENSKITLTINTELGVGSATFELE